jgi:hypothetical protein
MALYWLVYGHENEIRVSLQEAEMLIAARLRAAMKGVAGQFKEGHTLDAKRRRLVPKSYVGKVLTRDQAARLLERIGE